MNRGDGIRALLVGGRRRLWRRRLLEAAADWAGLVLPGLAILFLIGFVLPPTQLWSALAAAAAAAWIVATIAARVIPPVVRLPSLHSYALWLERRANLERNELVNALLLERDRGQWSGTEISRDLVDLALERARTRLHDLPFAQLHRARRLGPGLLRAAAAIVLAGIVWIAAPLSAADSARLFSCAGSRNIIPAIDIVIGPGDARFERGETVTVSAEIRGRRRPHRAWLDLRSPGGEWVSASMTSNAGEAVPDLDRYGFVLSGLSGDLDYRVHTAWLDSAVHRLHVVERLQAAGYRKVYEPPAYTGIAPQREAASTGDLAGVYGTNVTLTVLHRSPGASGRLAFADGSALPLAATSAGELEAKWTLAATGAYCVELSDPAEGDAWRSDSFHVEVVPDLPPAVRLLSPPAVITLPPDMHVTLEIDCVDDFGLREVALIYGRASDDPKRLVLAAAPDRKEARLSFDWDLNEITLLPGQDLLYYVQALDNDALRGPKTADSPLGTIRFPSAAEMYAAAEQERRVDIADLEEAVRGQQTLRQELSEVAREMLRDESLSWEKQQEVQDLVARQEQLAQQLESLRQSLDASAQRMENMNLFSMEMIDQVREIQQLVEQIQNEEFRQQLERMREALAKLDREELQRAMQDMKLTQEEISQALDRTLAMLRRLLAMEKLDELTQKIAELNARQAEVNKQLESGMPADSSATGQPPAGDTAEKSESGQADSLAADSSRPMSPEESAALRSAQEQIAKELEELQRALEELQKSSAENFQQLAEQLEKFRQSNNSQQTLDQMRKAQESMSQASRPLSLKFGRKAREGLQQMQGGMMDMRQQLSVDEAEAIARALYNIANRLVSASQVQESLVGDASRISPRQLAVREQELYDEIAVVGDSLMSVARKSSVITRNHLRQLGDILRDIESARNQMENGRRSEAVAAASESSHKLDAATKSLLEAANQARGMCSSNCPNPFNQMQCLSGQQNSLNQDTQQLFGSCQTPRLTIGQQDALMRLAARQEMIRQGLEEIRSQIENSGRAMGDIGSAASEMEEVIRELRSRQVDPRVIERQEKILSRLLNAQRSIRQRDENEERQSRTGVNPVMREGPPPVGTGESPAERLRRAMLRGSQDPVPPEYRRMVEMYLRRLMRAQ